MPDLVRALLQADVVVIQRKLLSPALLFLVRTLNRNLIYDFDDAVFLKDSGKASRHRYRLFRGAVKNARWVLAGNQYLAEQASLFNPHIRVLPTTVNITKYTQVHSRNKSLPNKALSNYIDLVWIGSSSTRKYLENMAPVLEKLGEHYPQLRLKIIADFDLPLNNLTTIAIPWSEKDEARELCLADIGIAPMVDDPWTRGKCALKVIQYMAAKLPVVSSEVGSNKEVIIDNETGLLVSSEQQWFSAIESLINDSVLRESMGVKGFERANNYYSQDYGVKVLLDTFDQIQSTA